ncbi:MAG: oligosaccharide flippase family protein [Alphaproteobacteria bacterium]
MNHADLEPLLRWFAVIPLLIAGSSVPTALVYKSMNFRVFTIRTIIANFIGGVTGIVMAVKGFGAYALVAQQIVMYSVTNAIIWPGCGWRPRLMFSPRGFAYRAGARHQDDGIVFRAIFLNSNLPPADRQFSRPGLGRAFRHGRTHSPVDVRRTDSSVRGRSIPRFFEHQRRPSGTEKDSRPDYRRDRHLGVSCHRGSRYYRFDVCAAVFRRSMEAGHTRPSAAAHNRRNYPIHHHHARYSARA